MNGPSLRNPSLPWRVRIGRYVNRQAANPRGFLGWLLGFVWRIEHRRINRATIAILEIAGNHRVLELGCGPGDALREAGRQAAHAEGLDVSETMIAIARKRNRVGIGRGRVAVRRTDGIALDLEPASFERAFSVHCIYFWKTPEDVLSQLAAALRTDGRLVLVFRPDSPDLPKRFRDDVYRFYAVAQVENMLVNAGFAEVRRAPAPAGLTQVVWLVAQRGNAGAVPVAQL